MSRLPDAEPLIDYERRGAMMTYLAALRKAGDHPALLLEDDIILTRGFMEKARAAIADNPDSIIQFFSRSARDRKDGTRRKAGSSFSMNQCTYFPAGKCAAILRYFPQWGRRKEHPTGYDLMIGDYLKEAGLGYIVHVPSLVDHRRIVSEIDPRRSSKRQSTTFVDPDLGAEG